jgi:hypothetical protein
MLTRNIFRNVTRGGKGGRRPARPTPGGDQTGSKAMGCYFLRSGHIVAAAELPSVSDKEAIAEAHVLFSKHENPVETFEVWDRTRSNSRASVHPPPTAGGSMTSNWR